MIGEELSFVHHFVPAQASSEVPTLLLLHGTGGNENDLIELGRMLHPGAALLSPRGKVLEIGMPRFFRRLAEGVFDMEDLKYRTHELADFVEAAADTYGFDLKSLIAVGYSNGANIAASMLLLRPGVLAGAILLRPMVPLEPEEMPDLSGVSLFIGSGRFDQLVPPEEGERLATLLRSAGADVSLHWHAGGHALSMEDIQAAQAWLKHQKLVKTTGAEL
jgi:predicted esterase